MQIDSGYAEVNGTRLYYETAGTGDPLVFVHGFTLDTRMWDDQFAAFAQRYRVIRYDQRGFGRSALPDGTPYSNCEDLKALLETLKIEQAHLVALSAGGRVAIDFALTYPHMTRSLVAIDAVIGGWHFSDEWRQPMKRVWQTAAAEGIPAAKRAWLEHPLFAPANEQPEAASRLAQMVNDYSGWHFVNRDTDTAPKPPAFERLEQIAVPTLVILGKRDLSDFHGIADALASRVPGARKIILPGVGHMANMEAPQAFNAAVLGWLEEQTTT